jgi:hypothetical protein
MRRIFAAVFFSLIVSASCLAQYSIYKCKTGSFHSCTSGVVQTPPGTWVDFYYTQCPNTPNSHSHLDRWDTGCFDQFFDCNSDGYELTVCNNCTQLGVTYTYTCNYCN